MTPEEYEREVVSYLRGFGKQLKSFDIRHAATVSTPDGDFVMDAVASFEAMDADFLVVIECKQHKDPIKREVVQVLADKQTASHAQKAFLFATSEFQSGAVAYA